MPNGLDMAPLNDQGRVGVRREPCDGLPLSSGNGLYARQDRGGNRGNENGDGEGRGRFRNGNNNGGNDNDGGRGDNGDRDGGRRFGGGFRGGGRPNNNNNDNDGNGRGFGDGQGGGNGRDRGGGRGDGNGEGGGNGRDRGDGRSRGGGGEGDGRGDRRIGGGGGGRGDDGNNGGGRGGGDASVAPSNASPSLPSSSAPPPEFALSPEVPTSVTVDPSSTSTSVAVLESALAPSSTVEGNPTVTAFIPLMTSDPSNLPGAGQYAQAPDVSSAIEPSPTSIPNGLPPPRPLDSGSGTGQNNGNNLDNGSGAGSTVSNSDGNNRLEAAQNGMDPGAERILIAVGSIGVFVLVCFVVWTLWRTMRKSKKRNGSHRSGFLSVFPKRLASRVPFFRKLSWQSLEGTTVVGSPPQPVYHEKADSFDAPSVDMTTRDEKLQQQPQPQPPQEQAQAQQQSLPPVPTEGVVTQPQSVYQPQFYPPGLYYPGMVTNQPYAHQPQQSFSSTNAAQFGATMASEYVVSTMQTGTTAAPTVYYHPSLMTQQFSTAPYQGTGVYRQPSKVTSEVSSLSSGFGDDDIIAAQSLVNPSPVDGPSPVGGNPFTARFSWMTQDPNQQAQSQSQQPPQSRRETMYTETSEDLPARFRTLTSWVDQQTGRIHRAQQREQAHEVQPQVPVGNPGIPGIQNPPPGEQSFGMMMDDEEKPRRVEETLAAAAAVQQPTQRSGSTG